MPQFEQSHSSRRRGWITFLALVAALVSVIVTLVFLKPGIVECRGVIEPEGWIPLYSPSTGIVAQWNFDDHRTVEEGELLMVLDDRSRRFTQNLAEMERRRLEWEREGLVQSLDLHRRQSALTESELRTEWLRMDRLFQGQGVSRNDVENALFALEDYLLTAEREERGITTSLELVEIELSRAVWEEDYQAAALLDLRLRSPASGFLCSADAVFRDGNYPLYPDLGVGRSVEQGKLLGYVIPSGSLTAQIFIPERRIGSCRPGDDVKVIPSAMPVWSYPPLKGRLISVSAVPSSGVYWATVAIDWPLDNRDKAPSLVGGSLTARIQPSEGLIRKAARSGRLFLSLLVD